MIEVTGRTKIAQTYSFAQTDRIRGWHAAPAKPAEAGRAWAAAKRTFDVAFALVALVALMPILLLVAVAIRLDSRGPLLFRQRRYGREMRKFTVLKFRTMAADAPVHVHRDYIAILAAGGDDDAGLKKLTDDPRVTRVGRLLRTTSLDELPQLVNVLTGRMSLIGPRPAIVYEIDHYLPRHYERFSVRPGLSGLWQVSGRNEVGFTQMLDLDVEYARNCNFRTDLRVFVRTPMAMVRGAA